MNCIEIISEIKKNDLKRTIEEAIRIPKSIITTLKIKKPPIPIVKLINDLGFVVCVMEPPTDNISGFIIIGQEAKEVLNNDKIICLSKNETIEKQRFVLAHEFAHYLFDFKEYEETSFFNTFDTQKANTEEEKIPSRFAAELLMPEEMFKKKCQEIGDLTKYEKINKLSKEFNTPQKSVIMRFAELGLKL